jgi:hypothetical protein
MKISEEAVLRMTLYEQWSVQEAPRRGLRDPWAHRPNKPIRKEAVMAAIEGKDISCTKLVYPKVEDEIMEAWRKERDEYVKQCNEWIAYNIFLTCGYEAFLEECNIYNLSEDFRQSILPCKSKDGQCNMFCPIYEKCMEDNYEN